MYEFDWSPNGKEFVVSVANGSGNNNWWVARLDGIDATTGAHREIAKPNVQIAQPIWSPDGSHIAFIGGLMSDQGSTGGDLYTVPAAGGVPHDLTPNITVSAGAFRWQSRGVDPRHHVVPRRLRDRQRQRTHGCRDFVLDGR